MLTSMSPFSVTTSRFAKEGMQDNRQATVRQREEPTAVHYKLRLRSAWVCRRCDVRRAFPLSGNVVACCAASVARW